MIGLRILPLAIATEVAKLKRTLALRMAIVSPLVVVGLYFLVGMNGGGPLVRPGADPWLSLTRNTVQLWTLLMLPLFITLETSLLAGLEHSERNWKFLLSLPIPKWTLYIAKLIVAIVLVWLAHAVLIGGTIQHWVSLRWPSFVAAMGFGMGAMVVGFIAVNSLDYGPWVPWSLTLHALAPKSQFWISPMAYSTVMAGVTAIAGAWHFTRSEM